ncbi:hypothetical protein EU95_0579 [Prochlorococcus marinus str. MIT 9201]|uniref:Uncharacterized protein n=1 Tax=Prochlorococcus marinus str. MIT 9201 TaxID=93057 RepID=A0A0A2A857_PROMR|nr:hypothetical protein [Prochlorococcus marinus]KGF96694.1 hypothetical protein EU95_0579 [Prochlorococcus marinus str. MIT 9201]
MAKRLSGKNKEEIIKLFIDGETVENLAIKFNCAKLTISRNLKKEIGEKKFKELTNSSNNLHSQSDNEQKIIYANKSANEQTFVENKNEEFTKINEFMEIAPLDYEIDCAEQKDLSSVPISEIDLPKIVYMIVDKKIELEIKYLRDFPSWEFLSKEELNRKTIQIFNELKDAKRFCTKDQKVIKVPNAEVFRIVAPILLSKGISRIINEEKLIAL